MQTLNLRIEDSFFPQFRAMIEDFVKEHKVEVIDNDEEYDYENNYPQSVVISSVEEVRRRVYEAEQEEGMSEEEYNAFMDKFFEEELGIKR
ncbi:MAG: hypothetical protein JXQ76_04955 [Campylobacterales bacterium]|nr:hypothetical protein [Campylobacterales bacterium]